jgi:Cytochrome c554 and c-prime
VSAGRVLLAAVLVAAAAGVIWWLGMAPRPEGGPESRPEGPGALGPPPVAGRPLTLRSSAECRKCHEEVFAEWAASHHALAYVNPEVQKLSKNFRDRDCLPCHVPRPVFETGLGNRVLEREVRLEEGVDCFTCHQFKDAMMGAPGRTSGKSSAPCNPMPYAGIRDLALCAPCHDQHKVMQDWLATSFASGPGRKDCFDCHMPAAGRKATADRSAYMGRSHRFPAAHDAEILRKAASMTATRDGAGQLLVTVRNDGTGHNVPSDERHRAVDLVLTFRDRAGNAASARVDRYRNPYRDEFDLKNPLRKPGDERTYSVPFGAFGAVEVRARRVPSAHNPDRKVWYPENTQIPEGEARSYVITLPREASGATVRLIYKLNPFVEDDRGTLMHEESIDLL